jgi:predicted nucleic acid-binding protein
MVAWIRDEPAAAAVEEFLEEASAGRSHLAMSWLNVAETYYILAKRDGPTVAEQFMTRLPSLPIRLVLPDEEGVMASAKIKAAHAVAFGDSFAIALAQAEQASVITGDGEIRRCGLVQVDWVGS